ncbi:MAG: AAA family ATPase [archaeon]
MKIIAITGLPLAGKSVITGRLKENGYKFFLMRSAVEAEMKKANVPVNNVNLRNFATDLRAKKGRGVVAELCLPHLDKLKKTEKVVVIDGVRSPEELLIFKKQYGEDFVLIAVWASLQSRFKRLGNRPDHTNDEPKNLEELKWRDDKEISWGLAESIVRADYMIVNEGLKDEYKAKINHILSELLKEN